MDGAESQAIAPHCLIDPLIIFPMMTTFYFECLKFYLSICLDYEVAVFDHYFKLFLTYMLFILS